jgi:hypothetical protein
LSSSQSSWTISNPWISGTAYPGVFINSIDMDAFSVAATLSNYLEDLSKPASFRIDSPYRTVPSRTLSKVSGEAPFPGLLNEKVELSSFLGAPPVGGVYLSLSAAYFTLNTVRVPSSFLPFYFSSYYWFLLL